MHLRGACSTPCCPQITHARTLRPSHAPLGDKAASARAYTACPACLELISISTTFSTRSLLKYCTYWSRAAACCRLVSCSSGRPASEEERARRGCADEDLPRFPIAAPALAAAAPVLRPRPLALLLRPPDAVRLDLAPICSGETGVSMPLGAAGCKGRARG